MAAQSQSSDPKGMLSFQINLNLLTFNSEKVNLNEKGSLE